MRYPDFSKYSWCLGLSGEKIVNIGWLSESSSYNKGRLDSDSYNIIHRLCLKPSIVFRHFEYCQICNSGKIFEIQNNSKVYFGNGEVRVFFRDTIFASPSLISHYIKVHNYLPPLEYIEAVNQGVWIEHYPAARVGEPCEKKVYHELLRLLRKQSHGFYDPTADIRTFFDNFGPPSR